MKSDARPPSPANLIMALGTDPQAAAALATACGLPLLAYDSAELIRALGRGQFCVVVWPDPHAAVLDALRTRTAPSVEAVAWRQSSHELLDLFARNRRKLLLVAASLILQGQPDDLRRLNARLVLAAPVIPPPLATPDLPALIARFMGAHLADLRPVWQELQASSLSPLEDGPQSIDLDPLAHLLAAEHAAADRATSETALQRTAMADLIGNLTEASEALAAARAQSVADDERLTRLDQELHLTRDQVASLTARLTDETTAHQTSLQRAEQTLQSERTAHQQGQTRTQTELDLSRDQLRALSGQLVAEQATTARHVTETTLQRAAMEELLGNLTEASQALTAARVQTVADEERLTCLDQSLHLSRDQLADLDALLTDETTAHQQARTELDLVRDQLRALSGQLAAAHIIPDATTEVGLLRAQLVNVTALLQDGSANPAGPGPAHILIETAFAALLADLATETDLRRKAQRHTITTAEALHDKPNRRQSVPNRSGS